MRKLIESTLISLDGVIEAPATGCEPVRRFSWRRGQRHRSGLQYLVSTGRLIGRGIGRRAAW